MGPAQFFLNNMDIMKFSHMDSYLLGVLTPIRSKKSRFSIHLLDGELKRSLGNEWYIFHLDNTT